MCQERGDQVLEKCPCCSGDSYEECCAPYLESGQLAPDPMTLMRSRYTAFCKENYDYVNKTWHDETRPDGLGEGEPNKWIGLEIIEWATDDEDVEGEVEFKARLIIGDQMETLHEVSSFDKIDGRWVYHSGEFKNENQRLKKISMKDPCPCGSGKKFKHCHFEK
jgi:SEC-C motif-containing protein